MAKRKLPKRGQRAKVKKKQYGGGIYAPDVPDLSELDLQGLQDIFANFSQNGQQTGAIPIPDATQGVNVGGSGLLNSSNLASQLTPLLNNLVNPNQESRLNLDQLNDIDRYKVNPTRGYLSFQQGGQASAPIIPLAALLESLQGYSQVGSQVLPSQKLTKIGANVASMEHGGTVHGGDNPTDNNFSGVLSSLISTRGGNLQDYDQIMNRIAFHETDPKQRMNPAAKQIGGGPGRGMFMYEPDSLKTAANRYRRFAKKNKLKTPKYIDDIRKGNLRDASKLNEAQQKELFLADMAEHPKARMQDVISGKQNIDDFWAKNWWAGPKNLRDKRKKQFNNSQAAFNKNETFSGGVLPEATVTAAPLQVPQQIAQESTAIANILPQLNLGGSISELGYSKNSPYKNQPFLDIQGNNITMKNTDKDLILIPDGDKPVLAKAGSGNYHFPNSTKVREIPKAQNGRLIDGDFVPSPTNSELEELGVAPELRTALSNNDFGIYLNPDPNLRSYFNPDENLVNLNVDHNYSDPELIDHELSHVLQHQFNNLLRRDGDNDVPLANNIISNAVRRDKKPKNRRRQEINVIKDNVEKAARLINGGGNQGFRFLPDNYKETIAQQAIYYVGNSSESDATDFGKALTLKKVLKGIKGSDLPKNLSTELNSYIKSNFEKIKSNTQELNFDGAPRNVRSPLSSNMRDTFSPELQQYVKQNFRYNNGGLPQAGVGGFFKKVGKGIAKGVGAIGNGIKDTALFGADNLTNLLLGGDYIKNGAYSYLGNVSDKTGNVLNKVGDVAVPLAAAAFLGPGAAALTAGIRGTTNSLNDGRNFGQSIGQGALSAGGAFLGSRALGNSGGFGNFAGNFQNIGGMFNGQGNVGTILGQGGGGLNLGALLGGAGAGFAVGSALGNYQPTNTPAFIPQGNVNYGRFGNQFGQYENGGLVDMNLEPFIAIQTEKVGKLPEQLLHLDGTITDVNAIKTHKKMKKDEVTDLVMQGTYVASAAKSMRINKKEAEDIIIGVKNSSYTEGKVGEIPEVLTMGDIFKKKKKMTPAEIAIEIKKKFPLVHKKEVNDPFTMRTNKENLTARAPYLINLVKLNEKKRLKLKDLDEVTIFNPPQAIPGFQNGGVVQKYQAGGTIANILGVATTALPLLQQLLGGGNQNSQRNPLGDALALGSIPLATAGINRNIDGRRAGLDSIQSQFDSLNGALTNNFQGLNQDRQNLNQQSLGTNLATTLLQERRLPRFTADFSRLENFNTRTPQNFVNSLATPTFDTNSILSSLGSRGAAGVLANQSANLQSQRNNAAIKLFQNQRGQDLNIANTLTQGYNTLSDRNTQLAQQEVGLRNQGINDLGRSFNTFTNNEGNRLTNAYETTTGLLNNQFQGNSNIIAQQSALEGQKALAIAQQMQNGAGILNSIPNVQQQPQFDPNGGYFSNSNFGINNPFTGQGTPALVSDIPGAPGLTPGGYGGLTNSGAGLTVPGYAGGNFNILNNPQNFGGQFTSQLPAQSYYNSYDPFNQPR